MGRRKIKKNETSLISFKVEKNSLESKWLNAQENRTQSLKYLIQLAKHQFGNKDLVAIGLKASLDNPDLNLISTRSTTKNVNSSTIVEKSDNDIVPEEETQESTELNLNSDNNVEIENDKNTRYTQNEQKSNISSKRKLIRSSKKNNSNYSTQLKDDDSIPDWGGLKD